MELEIKRSRGVIDQGDRIHDAVNLFMAWGVEEGRDDVIDREGYAKYLLGGIINGTYIIIVAYDGDMAIGMVGCHVLYDPSVSENIGIGERLYILPQYRGRGVLRHLLDATEELAHEMDVSELVTSYRAKNEKLAAIYERRGFVKTNVVMRRGDFDYERRD